LIPAVELNDGQETLAGFGELGPLAGAVEGFSLYPRLGFGDALGQGRPGDVGPLRGQREAAERGGKVEGFELLRGMALARSHACTDDGTPALGRR